MSKKISIQSLGSLSALGHTSDRVIQSYKTPGHSFSRHHTGAWVSQIGENNPALELTSEKVPLDRLDPSVAMAIYASREAMNPLGSERGRVAINIGSSRGATHLFEKHAREFYNGEPLGPLVSPLTTSGNVSSWVGQYLGEVDHAFSHSVTCSTGMQSVLNGIAWLKADMVDTFIAGATEAPLTPFTLAQLEALKIYSREADVPNKALDFDKRKNTFVLAEGAVSIALQRTEREEGLGVIEGWGHSLESIDHATSVSQEGNGLQKSMRQALEKAGNPKIDLVIAHAPGTLLGDKSEWNAIKSVFGDKIPAVTGNKWKIGHSLATSGLLSVEFGLHLLNGNISDLNPFGIGMVPQSINRILINASGFGGNCTSLVIKRSNA
ncbi:MAG: beta-ketoacyl synthase N-terminal-like domain-containing protein [Schleiferiaceae bacterium]